MLRWIVGATVVVVAAAEFAAPAYAGGARSFVSGGGSDVGTCERSAPCRTFGYAITQTNAGGEVVAIDSSGYGPVTITKSISLIAPKGVHAGISPSSGTAITIDAGAGDRVVLRNLYLNGANGASRGIVYNGGGAVVVEDCVIANFADRGIHRSANSPDAVQLTVGDTILRGNGFAALFLSELGTGSIKVHIDHTRAALNGIGFEILTGTRATITDSVATRNGSIGFFTSSTGAPARLFLERDTASGNGTGIQAQGGSAQAAVSNSTIAGNSVGLSSDSGGQLISRLNNSLIGNDTDGAFTGTFTAAYQAPRH